MEPKYTSKDLKAKYANVIYKTNNKSYGTLNTQVPPDSQHSLDRKFTTHLATSGMYRNEGLNTVVDNDRYINGSKDWMEKLH